MKRNQNHHRRKARRVFGNSWVLPVAKGVTLDNYTIDPPEDTLLNILKDDLPAPRRQAHVHRLLGVDHAPQFGQGARRDDGLDRFVGGRGEVRRPHRPAEGRYWMGCNTACCTTRCGIRPCLDSRWA